MILVISLLSNKTNIKKDVRSLNYFLNNKQLRGRLNERNVSILAHGKKPVTKRLYNNLRTSLLKLFETEKPGFMDKANKVQFQWIEHLI